MRTFTPPRGNRGRHNRSASDSAFLEFSSSRQQFDLFDSDIPDFSIDDHEGIFDDLDGLDAGGHVFLDDATADFVDSLGDHGFGLDKDLDTHLEDQTDVIDIFPASDDMAAPAEQQNDRRRNSRGSRRSEDDQRLAASKGGLGSSKSRPNALDPATLDPKRAKRILANRASAQRSRERRQKVISELQEEISELVVGHGAAHDKVRGLQQTFVSMHNLHHAWGEKLAVVKAQVEAKQAHKAALVAEIQRIQSCLTDMQATPTQ